MRIVPAVALGVCGISMLVIWSVFAASFDDTIQNICPPGAVMSASLECWDCDGPTCWKVAFVHYQGSYHTDIPVLIFATAVTIVSAVVFYLTYDEQTNG